MSAVRNLLLLMAILTISISLGQAADTCVCLNRNSAVSSSDDDRDAANDYIAPNGDYLRNRYYADPPGTSGGGYNNYINGFGVYVFYAGSDQGRVFFRYNGVAISSGGSYIAVGCPLYTANTGLCSNGPYGFASAAACSACGACCCTGGNTANGVCAISSGD